MIWPFLLLSKYLRGCDAAVFGQPLCTVFGRRYAPSQAPLGSLLGRRYASLGLPLCSLLGRRYAARAEAGSSKVNRVPVSGEERTEI